MQEAKKLVKQIQSLTKLANKLNIRYTAPVTSLVALNQLPVIKSLKSQ